MSLAGVDSIKGKMSAETPMAATWARIFRCKAGSARSTFSLNVETLSETTCRESKAPSETRRRSR